MFRRVFVACPCRLFVVIAKHDFAVIAPGGSGGGALNLGERFDQAPHAGHHVFRQMPAGGHQPGRGIGTMLGLADQIGGDDLGIGGAIGDDQDLGWSGKQVDADAAEQHALGLGDEPIAGAGKDVRLFSREQAEGHGGYSLDAAERQDMVGAAKIHGVEDGRMNAAALLAWGRTGNDVVDAGDLRRGDAHDGRCDMGVTAARHITARGFHRDQALARPQARRQLRFEFTDAVLLLLGEAADAVIGKTEIVLELIGNLFGRRGNGVLSGDDIAAPTVQLLSVFAGLVLAAGLDLGQHGGDDLARCVLPGGRSLCGLFQVFDGHARILSRQQVK